MTPTFEDDFARGEAAAKRLAARMEQAKARQEELTRAEEEDARVRQRIQREAAAEARAAETTTPETAPERTAKERIQYEREVKKAGEERILQERRYQGELTRTRQLSQEVYGPGSTLQLGAGGAGGNGKLPPRFFAQPPPGEPPPRRLLPNGQAPYQLLERNPEHPEEKVAREAREVAAGREKARSIRETAAAENVAAAQAERMGQAEQGLGSSIGRTMQFQRAANLEYQRFGALSSEWIGATARGATTIGELGRQTTATIGKFGGWLAAGSLLFVALDAVKNIGHGAIESASGVNQLQRVIKQKGSIEPNALQEQFRGLSQHFNLPIEDVTSAAYEMGKVFHTQNEALEASKAVLYSVKVGELDVATASRYLIAIINGFHLPASQLTGVFDQLNNAQNEFGISISDVEAGLAKASGSFNAATTKGSPLDKYHELLALIATAQKATGQTGQVVGTAIQRAPNFLRQSKNKTILKKYGIEAGEDLNSIITQAFEKSQTLPGHKIAELASAIFGPQYGARIGTPLFQQFDLYKKVLAKTSAKASKGSGETELQTQLGSLSEQIGKIKTELESLGSGLAEAGFFNLLGAGVESLTTFLSVANNVLDTFNRLPGPLKEALAVIIELRLGLAALRKFNVGENFAEGTFGRRLFSGPNREARLYQDLLRSEERSVRSELERNNNLQLATERRLPAAGRNVTLAKAELRALEAEKAEDSVLNRQRRVVNAAEAQENSLLARQVETTEIRRDLIAQLAVVEDDAAALQAARTDATARELARARGLVIPGSFNVGKLSARELARESGDELTAGGVVLPASVRVRAEQKAAIAERAVASQAAAAEEVGARASLTTRALTAAETATATAGAAIGRAGTAMRGLGSSLYELAGGPLGLLIGATFLIAEYGDNIGRAFAGGQDEISRAEHLNAPRSTDKLRAYLKRYEDAGALYRHMSIHGNPDEEREQQKVEAGEYSIPGVPSWFTAARARIEKPLIEAQRRANAQGRVAAGLFGDVLRRQVEGLEGLKPGTAHYQQDLTRVRENLQHGDLTAKEAKVLRGRLKELEAKNLNAVADVSAFFGAYNNTADKLMLAYIKSLGQLVSGGPAFAGHKTVNRFINASIVQGVRDLVSNKPAIQAKGEQTLNELPQILSQYEQQEFKAALALAHTQAGRNAAYRRYIGGLTRSLDLARSNFGSRGSEISSKLRETERKIAEFEKEGKAHLYSPAELHHHDLGVTNSQSELEDKKQYEDLRERAKRLRRAGQVISKQQREAERQLRVLIQEQREAETQEHIGILGELGQIAELRIGPEHPVAQARVTLQYAQRALSYAREHNAEPSDIRQALVGVLNARQGLEEAARQEAQNMAAAVEAMAQARANGDPIREAQAEIAKAQADIAAARTPAERLTAEAALLTAENKLREDRANIALAQLGLLAAQTDDPVKQAEIKVREADERLRTAHGRQAKLEARAARATAVRERRDAVANARIEDVEFQATIGRITTDQEIAAYTRLLRTLTLSKQARRSLIEKIHSLQEETSGQIELTTGSIRLPTLYDIRRAVQGGINGEGRGSSYQDNSTNHFEINIKSTDPRRAAREVDNAIRRNTRNSRRSAGHIG